MNSETETLMESVTCSCGNKLLISTHCGFDDVKSDTWEFSVRIQCPDILNDCCKARIQQGLDDMVIGMNYLRMETGKEFIINVELPGEEE